MSIRADQADPGVNPDGNLTPTLYVSLGSTPGRWSLIATTAGRPVLFTASDHAESNVFENTVVDKEGKNPFRAADA